MLDDLFLAKETNHTHQNQTCMQLCILFLSVISTRAKELCPDATVVRHHKLFFTLRYTGLASGTTKGLKKKKKNQCVLLADGLLC